MKEYTPNEWRRLNNTLETGGELKVHSRLNMYQFKLGFNTMMITQLSETWKLTVVLDYYGAMETYSRIGLLRSHGNLQSCWTTTKL